MDNSKNCMIMSPACMMSKLVRTCIRIQMKTLSLLIIYGDKKFKADHNFLQVSDD